MTQSWTTGPHDTVMDNRTNGEKETFMDYMTESLITGPQHTVMDYRTK